MRNELRLFLLLAALAGTSVTLHAARAADAPQGDDSVDPAQDADRPEYHSRPLPTDTFTPAESLPEDFPVAIPSDM
ncbi:MAG: hypothetical protein HY749_21000 [Gammaproteobacteria bacterium]|nr:hypothetical protein [Gammaproteobacteria bacterium]MBI5616965.1 hypothetical protein [Gammaproteobacteria bacterium]